ncbi:hypothetical protein CQ054_19680 [Ochrobactrum sp. MYb29]|uniref:hypothetical protein n=1 Tax=Brucella pituitosa TaxID=571256 RepID=UPI000C26F6C2|nr:hypothetical protein [Brucella pituitosa]PJO49407.1 hypothetical protein CWE02_06490 [Brucella pituitosa]PRA82533.1 hypothetical protein CQ054_19680 [Ochrobactrum sp. MYb29]TCQ71947.1 hypothetical protein EDF68_12318 [Ochrobactrum sp. BH3]
MYNFALVAEAMKTRLGLKEIINYTGALCLISGIASIIGFAPFKGLAGNDINPLISGIFLLLVSVILICFGGLIGFINSRLTHRSSRDRNLIEYYKTFSDMTVLEKQLRFKELFGIAPDVREIDLVLSQRYDPANAVKRFVRAYRVIKLENNWFVTTIRSPFFGQNLLFLLSLFFFLISAGSLTIGSMLLALNWQDSKSIKTAVVLFLLAIGLIAPVLTLFNEALGIADGRKLIKMSPENDLSSRGCEADTGLQPALVD